MRTAFHHIHYLNEGRLWWHEIPIRFSSGFEAFSNLEHLFIDVEYLQVQKGHPMLSSTTPCWPRIIDVLPRSIRFITLSSSNKFEDPATSNYLMA